MKKTLSDQELIEQVRDGYPRAFDVLIKRYSEDMHHTARLYLKGCAEIEDVVQEAASQAFHHIDRLRDADQFPSWLRAIVRNRCLSHLRSRRSHWSYEEETREGATHIQVDESYWGGQPFPAPDQNLIDQEETHWVQVAVGQLSEKNRSVTSLHYFEGKSYEEIAAVLDVSLSTIEGRLYRARKQLKEVIVNMAKADIDQVALQEAITAATQGLQDDIAQIKRQLAVINWEDNHSLDHTRSAAGQTLTKLPTDQENPVIWGLAGAYRLGTEVNQRRLSFWSFDDIDKYLNCAQDADIARFASLFTDPAAVGVIRQLVKRPQQVADLATLCSIDREALDGVLEGLIEAGLVQCAKDGRIEPVKDSVPFLMTLIGLTVLYRVQVGELETPMVE